MLLCVSSGLFKLSCHLNTTVQFMDISKLNTVCYMFPGLFVWRMRFKNRKLFCCRWKAHMKTRKRRIFFEKMKWLKVQSIVWLLTDVRLSTTDGQLGLTQKRRLSFKPQRAFELSSRGKREALACSLYSVSVIQFDVEHNVFWGSTRERRLIDFESGPTPISTSETTNPRQWKAACLNAGAE